MFIKIEYCKICLNKDNKSLFKINYNNQKMVDFFTKFYGEKVTHKILELISNDYYELLECNKCNFIWQKNHPNQFIQSLLYNDWISFDNSQKKSLNQKIKTNFFNNINIFLKIFFNNTKLKFLDYGAGFGNFSIFLNREHDHVFALETSIKKVEFLQKSNIKIINYDNYKNYESHFDFIFINQVVEHLDDFNKFFKIILYLSKKNTILYISVPNSKKFSGKIDKGAYQPLEHLNSFKNKNLLKLFKNNSFKRISIFKIISLIFKKGSPKIFLFKRIYFQLFTTSIFFIKEN